MQPEIHLNYLAIVVAVIANFALGWLWFGPMFGKSWAREMGMPMDQKPAPGVMVRGMLLMILGSFLTAWVLAHDQLAWMHWMPHGSTASFGFASGFFIWLGFFLPQHLGGVAWENKSWKLFSINVAYAFVSLQVFAQILAHWR